MPLRFNYDDSYYADTWQAIPRDGYTQMVENMEPAQVKYMTDRIPMKRCGDLSEVAALATWIVSEEASFNTGFTFDLTGGRAVY